MVKKSLHAEAVFKEILDRTERLEPFAQPKWGRMNAPQMLSHNAKILQVAAGKIILPEIPFLLKAVGIITKKEMKIFNNGIPHNMPTFDCVKAHETENFTTEKENFLLSLREFREVAQQRRLPPDHSLFGRMSHDDWGYLVYKHIDHHFKQFGI